MIMQSILFIFTACNDSSSSDKNGNCEKEKGNCLCGDCFNGYMQNPDGRSEDWERAKEIKIQNEDQDEGCCICRLARNFLLMFSGTTDTSESYEQSRSTEETQVSDSHDETENNGSARDN